MAFQPSGNMALSWGEALPNGPGPSTNSMMTGRIAREKKTLKAMMRIYCRDNHHGKGELCQGCSSLLEYAYIKLDKCPFHEEKPQCSECSIHCYKPHMREEVREVMRYSGPRMIFSHPVLAILHIIDGYIHKPVSLREFKDSSR